MTSEESVGLLNDRSKSSYLPSDSLSHETREPELQFEYDRNNGCTLNNHQRPHKWPGRFLQFIKLKESGSGQDDTGHNSRAGDLRPVESARRTWTATSYVLFWIADSFNINTIQIASTGLQNHKLSALEVTASIFLGYFLAACFLQLSARVGAYNHIAFPVSCRTSFGLRGALWPVANRVVMATVWYAVQSWIGGQCVQLMVKAVFARNSSDDKKGNNQGNWQDHFAFELGAFAIFWGLSLFVIMVPPHKLRALFQVKAYLVPVASIGLLAWALFKAHYAGEAHSTNIGSPASLSATMHNRDAPSRYDTKFWTFVTSTMNCLANFANLIVNAPDFSRFAKSPQTIRWANLVSIPVCFTVTSVVGILVSSASRQIYHDTYWSPLDVLDRFLADILPPGASGPSLLSESSVASQAAARFGVFTIALAFMVAVMGTNASANSICVGTDLSSVFPSYINIRRGGFVCAFCSLFVQPWRFFESSSRFTVYLSAYSVFLSGIAGVVVADYYVVRRGYVLLHDLYCADRHNGFSQRSVYSYGNKRVASNWRAYAAYVVGMAPNMPGFLQACGYTFVAGEEGYRGASAAASMYRFSYFIGFATAAVTYVGLCYAWPLEGLLEPSFWRLDGGWYEEWKEVELFGEDRRSSIPEP